MIFRILFTLWIILTITVTGQIKIHKHITTDDGLLSNEVMSIIQDNKGYMWFATMKGISVWDGITFKNIRKADGLTSSAILHLLETPDSTILINSFGKGLISIKNNVWDTIDTKDGLNRNFVINLKIIDGKPIIITSGIQTFENGKIIKFSNAPDMLTEGITDFLIDNETIYITSKSGLYVNNGNSEKLLTTKNGLITNVTSFLKKDYNDNILIATSVGLNKYKDGKITTLKYNGKLVNWAITDVICTKDGTNYYSSDKGLLIEKNGKIELLTTAHGLLENQISNLGKDRTGNIYIGYKKSGISIYKPEQFTNYVSKDFAAQTIIQDNNKNIIIGTDNGITILENNRKVRITQSKGLLGNYVLSISKRKNNIFVGTDKGLNLLRNKKVSSIYKLNNSNPGIYDIEFSPYDDILLSVRRQGITTFTKKNKTNNPFIKTLLNTFDSTYINSTESRNRFLLTKKKNKPKIINGDIVNIINDINGLKSSWVVEMLFTNDSTLYLGYHGSGVSSYKNGVFNYIGTEDGLTDRIINTIFQNSDGSLWFGTAQGGICIYDGKQIIDTLNVEDGLSSDDIRGILKYDDAIYISTENGLNILTQNGNGYFIRQIKKEDGLVANDCNRNALYLDDNNNLWIGTTKGVSVFNPKTDNPFLKPPKVYITDLEVFNESFPLELLEHSDGLNYDQNYLKFTYTGINLSAPRKTVFQYKLVGVDKYWVTSKDNNVQYTSLNDGDYTFEVKAMNEWGYWSEPTSLSFVINPAWWETWWARLLFVTTLGFLLWVAFQYRLNYLLKLERLRTKIASDLHDEVGSMLTQISLNVDFLSFTKDEKKKEEKSKFIRTKTNEIITIMNDIIWSIDSRNDNLESLVERIRNFAYDHCSQKDIKLYFSKDIDNTNKQLKINFRQNIMLIAKEAINNAVKYSDCSELLIKIELTNNNFELFIKDNGIGFDFENVRKGNGLKNMIMRAESIDAKITFKNENGFSLNVLKENI